MYHLRIFSLFTVFFCVSSLAQQHSAPPHPHITTVIVDSDDVAVLRLRPGYVTSVFLPEEVNAIVLGDPGSFRAEHSENEPRLVTVKPVTPKAAETNLLVTTKSGREVSLHLISEGRSNNSVEVDFVLQYEEPASALIPVSRPSLFIPDTKEVDSPAQSVSGGVIGPAERELIFQSGLPAPTFIGRALRVSVGRITNTGDAMIVGFSVLNASADSIELLPPQVELAGPQRKQHNRSIKAEPVALKEYQLTMRHLAPGARADGVVVFDRPTFKESTEHLLLEVARADAVDQPVLIPLAFTAPAEGESK
jgi:hypothetical protein